MGSGGAGGSRPSPAFRRFAAAAGALLLLLLLSAGAVHLRGRAAGPPRTVSAAAESALRVALPPALPRARHSVLPDVFLLGEPKTGSTFLWRCLGDAAYFAAGKRLGLPWFPGPADGLEKEIFFWGGPFGGVPAARKAAQAAGVEDAAALSLEEALAWNGVVRREAERGVFGENGIGSGAVLSDFTPTYLHDLGAANRVYATYAGRPSPPAFIVLFRDPLERAFSNWSLHRRFHKSMGGWEVSAGPRREGQRTDLKLRKTLTSPRSSSLPTTSGHGARLLGPTRPWPPTTTTFSASFIAFRIPSDPPPTKTLLANALATTATRLPSIT